MLEEGLDDDEETTAAELAAGQEAWERTYEADRSWEQLEEDETGHLRAADPTEVQRAKRRVLLPSFSIIGRNMRLAMPFLVPSKAAPLSEPPTLALSSSAPSGGGSSTRRSRCASGAA